MSRPRPAWKACLMLPGLLVSLALTAHAAADWDYYQYPEGAQTGSYVPRLKYLKFDVEAEKSSQSSSSAGAQINFERLYLAPAIGIGWDYFLYHPDLLNFSVLAEPGYSWQDSGPSGATTHQDDVLLNGTFNARLLQLKPYSTTLFATAVHDTHQYDFYNSVIEDSKSWGVSTGYREGPVPVTVSFQQIHRDTTGFSYDTSYDQFSLDFHARNERAKFDTTDLSYQFSQYDSTTSDAIQKFHDSTSFHYMTLTDAEHFDKSTLNSTLLFDHTDTAGSASDNVNVFLDYAMDHTPRLRSFYNYSFAGFTTEDGDSIQNAARAGLQHQLYDSLSSSADLHGLIANNSFGGSSLDLISGGPSASATYTKLLGDWGRLTVGNSAVYDFTEQTSSGGTILISRESHSLPAGQWVRLNQPRVIALVAVTTDAAHGELPLTENIDYFVDRTRDPWQLQRGTFSLILNDTNNTVLVSYTVQPNPSGNYSTLSDVAQIRLDLWHNMLGLYARYNFVENHAYDPGFVLEDVQEVQAGADFNRQGLRLSANYTDRHSSLFSYYSYDLSEGYVSTALPNSSIGIDLHQRWSFYPSSGSTGNNSYEVTYYDFILRYIWHPVRTLSWNNEAGYQLQRGNGLNEDLFVARSYLNWLIGKLDLHLGYEFQDQKFVAEERQRHFLFLRARRNF